MYWTSLV